jgi:D-alanyl-D-alanine carboxypeptidase/D-alanyl-D-alanine-endopeptidase (penicillin-binding protein 4)
MLTAAAVCSPLAAAQTQPAPAPAVVHPAFPSGAGSPLAARIAALLSRPDVSRAHWGIAVTAMDGTPLYGMDEGQFFRPASNAKLFTTAATMALLGPETRVTTVVTADAPPDAAGVVHGDIVLHGAGDANLSGRHIPYEEPALQKLRVEGKEEAETAAEKTAADAAGAAERAKEQQSGEAANGFNDRAIAEAENTAAAAVRARHIPDELLPMEDLAAQVAAAGVKSLTGALRGDASLWRSPDYADSWDAGDGVWGYGAAVSALEFNDGQLELHVIPGASAGERAQVQIEPNVNFFGLPENTATTVAKESEAGVDVQARAFPASNVVEGAVVMGHPDVEEIAVQNPALFAVDALQSRLFAHGIAGGRGTGTQEASRASTLGTLAQEREPVDLTFRPESETSPVCGREFTCGVVLAKRVSPTLAEDVTVTLKVSQNLHAEMMLRRLGRAYGTEGSFAQGARVVRQFLLNAGLDGGDFVFYDGSGLSGHDLVTPRATAQLLAYAAKQPWFAQWKAALPVGGEDGTLASRFPDPPLKDHLFAKTGTLGESRGLSGYVDCASGHEVIFSIFVDDHAPGGSADRKVMDQIVGAIAATE